MKRIIVFLFFIVCIHFHGNTQNYFTLTSGVNFSDIIGVRSDRFTIKQGYFVGVGYHFLISNPFSFGFELALNSKGFSNSYSDYYDTRNVHYKNIVEQNNIYLPFLLKFHSKYFSFDFGPHFEFVINRTQLETETFVFYTNEGEVIEEQTYINRHNLRDRELGVRFGLSVNLMKNFEVNTKYIQTFTPLGREYNWQRQRTFQFGFCYNIGKSFIPKKINVSFRDSLMRSENFKTINSNNIERVEYKYIGDGNYVNYRFKTVDKMSFKLVEKIINNSNGDLRLTKHQSSVKNVNFPFNTNLVFRYQDPATGSIIDYFLEFEIYKDGVWDVIIYY